MRDLSQDLFQYQGPTEVLYLKSDDLIRVHYICEFRISFFSLDFFLPQVQNLTFFILGFLCHYPSVFKCLLLFYFGIFMR